MTTDKRRYGVIEVRRRNAETYHLRSRENCGARWNGRTIGKLGASKTPPATAHPCRAHSGTG
jgi:hypothetical protein